MITIFTKEKSNLKRQIELDLAKSMAIVFMIWVHVNELYLSESAHGQIYNRIIEFLGSPPAAPIFMLSLGVGIIYSSKNGAKELFKRGLILLISGYILNLARDIIPYLILAAANNDPSYIIDGWPLLWGIDILQFAGLTFIFFALVKKFKLKNTILFLIWCILLTLNILVKDISFESELLNKIFGLLWGTDEFSWFPFLTWISFPIAGYYFGQALIRCENKNIFYKNLLLISGSISLPLWLYSYVNDVRFGAFGDLYQTEYYHHDIMGNIILIMFALFWISLCFFVSKYIPQVLYKIINRWSRNITQMYCVHQIIIGILLLILEENMYTPAFVCSLFFIVFWITDIFCLFLNSINKKRKSRYDTKVSSQYAFGEIN